MSAVGEMSWETCVAAGASVGKDIYRAILDGTLTADPATLRAIPLGAVDEYAPLIVEDARRAARRGVLAVEMAEWQLSKPHAVPIAPPLIFPPDLPSLHLGTVTSTTCASCGTV